MQIVEVGWNLDWLNWLNSNNGLNRSQTHLLVRLKKCESKPNLELKCVNPFGFRLAVRYEIGTPSQNSEPRPDVPTMIFCLHHEGPSMEYDLGRSSR